MRKKYLVTGGCGFLASKVIARLLESHELVTVADNLERGKTSRLPKHSDLQFVNLSVLGEPHIGWSTLLCQRNFDSILHFAAINGTSNFYNRPYEVLETGVVGTWRMLQLARSFSVPEFVFVSSSEVYAEPDKIPTKEEISFSIPDPKNPRFSYAASKQFGELMSIHAKEIPRVLIVRPHNIYGEDAGEDHVIPQLIRKIQNASDGIIKIQGTGKETRAFMYIDDFVDAFSLVLKKGKDREVYNIGVSKETAIKELAETLISLSKKKIRILKESSRLGSPKRRCPDISKIKTLGFKQKTSLKEGLQKTLDWYLKQ